MFLCTLFSFFFYFLFSYVCFIRISSTYLCIVCGICTWSVPCRPAYLCAELFLSFMLKLNSRKLLRCNIVYITTFYLFFSFLLAIRYIELVSSFYLTFFVFVFIIVPGWRTTDELTPFQFLNTLLRSFFFLIVISAMLLSRYDFVATDVE